MSKKLTQVQFAQVASAFAKNKEAIEKEMATKTLTEMAEERKLPISTFRNLCKAVEIDCGKRGPKLNPLLIQDILTVLARVAASVQVADPKCHCEEIQKYLK